MNEAPEDPPRRLSRAYLKELVRANRRPVVLGIVSFAFLASYFVLVRAMAHGHVAHVLLGAGNGAPPASAAALAIALVIVRFVTVILVPGLLLAAFAEISAYVLVGPRRDPDEQEPEL